MVPSQSRNTRTLSGSSEGIPSGPIETAHEGLRRSGRTHQPRQQPDNVYFSMKTTQVESLTDRLWERFLGDSQNPQGPPEPQGQFTLGRSDSGYDSCETALWQASDRKRDLQLIIEEGGDCFQNFLLAAARRTLPFRHQQSREATLPDPAHICDWTYNDILHFSGKLKEEWRQACLEEISTLKKRSIFELVTLPNGFKPIRNRWVFDIKSDG